MAGFSAKLNAAMARNQSLVCIGLDPDRGRVPPILRERPDWVAYFNAGIVEATADLVCAYKPNLGFYEALGTPGWEALRATCAGIPAHIPVLADAKRGDIGSSAERYATAIFDELRCDAATVNPYMGHDAVEPFLAYPERGVFVLCKTSNPGAADFQDLECEVGGLRGPLYTHVARAAAGWNTAGNVGLVVGATQPQAFAAVRAAAPDLPLLVPGVGAQGGDLAMAVHEGLDARGVGLLISSSRAILYASSGPDWQSAARQATLELRAAINALREAGADGTRTTS